MGALTLQTSDPALNTRGQSPEELHRAAIVIAYSTRHLPPKTRRDILNMLGLTTKEQEQA